MPARDYRNRHASILLAWDATLAAFDEALARGLTAGGAGLRSAAAAGHDDKALTAPAVGTAKNVALQNQAARGDRWTVSRRKYQARSEEGTAASGPGKAQVRDRRQKERPGWRR